MKRSGEVQNFVGIHPSNADDEKKRSTSQSESSAFTMRDSC